MRDCEYYREKISCLIDDELSEQDTAELMEHIADCPECKALYDAFSAVSSAASESMVEPPEHIAPAVMREVNAIAAKRKRGVWIKSLSAAACIALVMFVGARAGLLNDPGVDKAANESETNIADDDALKGVNGEYGDMYRGEDANEAEKSFDGVATLDIDAQSAYFASASGDMYYVEDSAELEKLKSLMAPLTDIKRVPEGEPDYNLVFDCGEDVVVMEIYIEDDVVFADSGDGPYVVAGTPEEIKAYLK